MQSYFSQVTYVYIIQRYEMLICETSIIVFALETENTGCL